MEWPAEDLAHHGPQHFLDQSYGCLVVIPDFLQVVTGNLLNQEKPFQVLYLYHQSLDYNQVDLQLLSYLPQVMVVKTHRITDCCFPRSSAHLERQHWLEQFLDCLDGTDAL